jgi:hydroxypyruvate isomerase
LQRREFFGGCAAAAATAALPQPPGSRFPLESSESDSPLSQTAPPFQLSVMLWTVYENLPFEQRLDKVAEAGFHSVELVLEYKDWTKEQYASARRKRHELKMGVDGIAGVWHSLADPADREATLKAVAEFVPTLREFECNVLIMQTGDKVPGLSQEQMHAECIETLKRTGDIAAKNNFELLIENIDPEENPKYFLMSSAEGFEIVRSVGNPHVKFLYDFFHEQIAEGNLIAKLEKNLDYLGLVHIADVPGRHEPGTGEINYASIFRKLGHLNYTRFVAMEFKPTGDTVAMLRAAREMAERYGAEGRRLSAASQNDASAGVLAGVS